MIAAAKTYITIGALAVLLATNAYTAWQLSSERKAHQSFRLDVAERVAAAERQRADQEAKNRQIEKELINAQEAHAAEVQTVRQQLDATRASGRVVADRVRDAARATAALAGQACADTTSAAVRETAERAARVLADVYVEAEQLAGELAATADDRGLAGRACERAYQESVEALSRD